MKSNTKTIVIASSIIILAGLSYLVWKKMYKKDSITKEQKENLDIKIVRAD